MDRFINFFNDFESFFNDFNSLNERNLETKTENGIDKNGEWQRQTTTSKDGSIRIVTFSRTNSTKSKIRNIEEIKKEMEICVESQNFERAAELRDLIKSMESNEDSKKKLNKELEIAIKEQNFERAIEIRDQLKGLK